MGKNKRRILKIGFHNDAYDKIRRGIIERRFRKGSASGFLVDVVNSNSINASYVLEKTVFKEVELPNGDRIDISQPYIYVSRFNIDSGDESFITVFNPPRTLAHLFSELEEISDFNITVVPLVVDLEKFYNLCQSLFPRCRSYNIVLKSISISEQAVGAMSIQSQGDAFQAAKLELADKRFDISRMAFEADFGRFEVSKSGLLETDVNLEQDLYKKLVELLVDSSKVD